MFDAKPLLSGVRITNNNNIIIVLIGAFISVFPNRLRQRQRVSTCLAQKNSHTFLVLLTGFEPSSFGSESDALPIEPPHDPNRGIISSNWGIF